nr:MAG TPA: hypothetical protein [Caudoviricetes sp.]DAU54879.1 MAG TPA: hypothetical protein [Caudoviricetes sp.]
MAGSPNYTPLPRKPTTCRVRNGTRSSCTFFSARRRK